MFRWITCWWRGRLRRELCGVFVGREESSVEVVWMMIIGLFGVFVGIEGFKYELYGGRKGCVRIVKVGEGFCKGKLCWFGKKVA